MKDKKKKILLIYPQSQLINDVKQICNFVNEDLTHNDLLYLASVAEACGFEAKVKVCDKINDFITDFNNYAPDYLVAKITTSTFKSDMEAVAATKMLNKNLVTIVFGAPFLTYNTNVIYENPFVDIVIMGEPEFVLKDILEGAPYNEVLGICYSDNMQPVKNELRPFINNLDDLPLPVRHLLEESQDKIFNNKKTAIINVARGCPYVDFSNLYSLQYGLDFRARSAEHILFEIKDCVNKFGIKNFVFDVCYFNIDINWAINLCNKIIEAKLKINWSTNLLLTNVDKNLIILMSKAGCNSVNLDIESGAPEIMNNIGKNIILEDAIKVIELFKKYHIKTNNNFYVGYPWETEKTMQATFDFAKKSNIDNVDFNFVAPYPGTKFFAYAMLNKLVEKQINYSAVHIKPLVRTHDLSENQLIDLFYKYKKNYYLSRKIFFKKLLEVRNLSSFKSLFTFYKTWCLNSKQ